jgi:hypothetical protein
MDEHRQPQRASESEREREDESVRDLEPNLADSERVKGGINPQPLPPRQQPQ